MSLKNLGSLLILILLFLIFYLVAVSSVSADAPTHQYVFPDGHNGTINQDFYFYLYDADGDTMNYSVTTAPNVGAGSNNDVSSGWYSQSLSTMTLGVEYTITLKVTDGTSWTNTSYTFNCTTLDIPTPAPLDFSTYSSTTSTISLTSETATDTNGTPTYNTTQILPLSYNNSQTSIFTGLTENTQYKYVTYATDPLNNSNYPSSPQSVVTKLSAPTTADITFDHIGTANFTISITEPTNPTVGSTGCRIESPSGANSYWLTGIYTFNTLDRITLDENTDYKFQVKYRNQEGVSTSISGYKTETTLISDPEDAPFVYSSSPDELNIAIFPPNNYDEGNTAFYLNCTQGGLSDTGWRDSGWIRILPYDGSPTRLYINSFDVEPGTEYKFKYKLRNQDGTETAYSPILTVTADEFVTLDSRTNVLKEQVQVTYSISDTNGSNGIRLGTEPDTWSLNFSKDYSDGTHTFTQAGLNNSTYYYLQAWSYNSSDGFQNSSTLYFLTQPSQSPINPTVTARGYNYINLSWTNATTGVNNQTTVVRAHYNEYPAWDFGITVYNGTAEYYNWTGLNSGDTWFFTFYTYINASGSPYYWSRTTFPTYTMNSTTSGLFNFNIQWENATYGYIPLDWGTSGNNDHKFIVHYSNAVEYNEFEEGTGWTLTQTPDFTDSDISDGNFSINISASPSFVEFYWKSDGDWFWDDDYYCHRTLVVDDQNNLTFYLRTDLETTPGYLLTVADWLNQSGLVEYTYKFVDNNGEFSLDKNPFAIIYTYNQNNEKMVIHSEYFDKNMEIHPSLVYGKTYYLGVKSDSETLDFIGKAPTGTSADVEIQIPKSLSYNESFYNLIDLSVGYTDIGIFCEYSDTTNTLVDANFTLFSQNGTQLYTENSSLFAYNFTNTTNTSLPYILILNITTTDYGVITSGYIPISPTQNYTITSNSSIDTIITILVGETPVKTSTGLGVSYAYLVVLLIALVGLLAFKPEQAHIGLLLEGIILSLSAGAITGFSNLFADYSWTQGIVLGSVGFFLIILGIWASMNAKNKEDKE